MNDQQPSDTTETEADVTPPEAELKALQRAWAESFGPAIVLQPPAYAFRRVLPEAKPESTSAPTPNAAAEESQCNG